MANNYEGSYQAYNVLIEHDVLVAMPDGIKLAADVYYPTLDGARAPGVFPVILERTPYNKAAAAQVTKGKYFARRGYVCVIQDVRGRFASEGEWYAFAEEAEDGYATVEWLGTQPWSTGKVGTMGDSYAGSDQSALATLNPPHLATMIVAVGASNYYHSSMRHNGALEQRFFIYALRMAATSKEAEADPALKTALQQVLMEKVPEMVRQFPLKAGTTLLRRLPSYERWPWTCSPTPITTTTGKGSGVTRRASTMTNTPTCRPCTGAAGTTLMPATPPKATCGSAL